MVCREVCEGDGCMRKLQEAALFSQRTAAGCLERGQGMNLLDKCVRFTRAREAQAAGFYPFFFSD